MKTCKVLILLTFIWLLSGCGTVIDTSQDKINHSIYSYSGLSTQILDWKTKTIRVHDSNLSTGLKFLVSSAVKKNWGLMVLWTDDARWQTSVQIVLGDTCDDPENPGHILRTHVHTAVNRIVIQSDFYSDEYRKYQENIMTHEFGHILGFGDCYNPKTIWPMRRGDIMCELGGRVTDEEKRELRERYEGMSTIESMESL